MTTNNFINRALAFAAALTILSAVVAPARAQQASANMGPAFQSGTPGTFAIRNARIVTAAGPDIENGTVVVRTGDRGGPAAKNSPCPKGATVVEARGLPRLPGMIDIGT